MFDKHIQSGKNFKDAYGQFNYGLCYEDSLLKLERNSSGELVPMDIRTSNEAESAVKSTLIGQFNDKDQLHGVGRIACTGTENDFY